jgi:hypothetical protein
MKPFVKSKIITYYNFFDNDYLTLKHKNKEFYVFSRAVDASVHKEILMETSTTHDTLIKILNTTELPKNFLEEIKSGIKNQEFLNKILIYSKVSNMEGFTNIKELDFFSYNKKKIQLLISLYVSRLNYNLTLKRTRRPFTRINKTAFTIEKLIERELLKDNEMIDKEIGNEIDKDSSFLIATENYPETDFYKEDELKEDNLEPKMEYKEEEEKNDFNEDDIYTDYSLLEFEEKELANNLKYTNQVIEEMQGDSSPIILPQKETYFFFDKKEKNKIKWIFSNIKSTFSYPIFEKHLVYYNYFSENFYIVISLLEKMNLCLSVENHKLLQFKHKVNQYYLLMFLEFIIVFFFQIIKFFLLVHNLISNSFKNVLINTFLKEFEIKLEVMLRIIIRLSFFKQSFNNDYKRDVLKSIAVINMLKAIKGDNLKKNFNNFSLSFFLQGMRTELDENEAENIIDFFYYNKDSFFFIDDFSLKTTLLEELLPTKFEIYISQLLDEEEEDEYYKTLPLDFEEQPLTI